MQGYDSRGGAVKFIQWLEKMEAVIGISGCTPDQRVRYVANSFTMDMMSRRNTRCQVRGRAATEAMSWYNFKGLIMKSSVQQLS